TNRASFFVERPEEKKPKQASKGKRSDSEASFEKRTPGHKSENDENRPPNERHPSRKPQEIFWIRLLAPEAREIQHRACCKRIKRAAAIGHCHRENQSDQNSGRPRRHVTNEECRQNCAEPQARCQKRRMLRENEKQNSNEKKQTELEEDKKAGCNERSAAVALVSCRKQALHDRLVGAVAGHGEKCSADEAGPERVSR